MIYDPKTYVQQKQQKIEAQLIWLCNLCQNGIVNNTNISKFVWRRGQKKSSSIQDITFL